MADRLEEYIALEVAVSEARRKVGEARNALGAALLDYETAVGRLTTWAGVLVTRPEREASDGE